MTPHFVRGNRLCNRTNTISQLQSPFFPLSVFLKNGFPCILFNIFFKYLMYFYLKIERDDTMISFEK